MTRARSGFAMLLALAGVLVLAGLAALANISATAAIRESTALLADAQGEASRSALRARLGRALVRMPSGALMRAHTPLGGGDTALAVTPLGWPWHRVVVAVDGAPVVAEFARAGTPQVPWCSSVVMSRWESIAPNALTIAAFSACTTLVAATSTASIEAFDGALAGGLVLGATADTVRVAGESLAPDVWRASRLVELAAFSSVSGLVIAPVVRIAAGASVRGMVVAAESLFVEAGATVTADELAVRAALAERARLHPVGRRGLLLPP